MTELCEVVITAPDPDWLRRFTRELVDRHLCSSVHNFSAVHSIHRWQGEEHERTEGRASLHTRRPAASQVAGSTPGTRRSGRPRRRCGPPGDRPAAPR
ncbi:divalent cation tolerance protein CutA [Pseudonocardia sp. MH-G8]|uniref:divalent cation tolerance protein CutA n=1 Tax=Pseudonocardia sp. MH-G8 TaxID=1854588 RepID=UPI000BA0964C|nr:hypothetical protein CFP66_11070 [Pseudonocardia sp. MH-G8]